MFKDLRTTFLVNADLLFGQLVTYYYREGKSRLQNHHVAAIDYIRGLYREMTMKEPPAFHGTDAKAALDYIDGLRLTDAWRL